MNDEKSWAALVEEFMKLNGHPPPWAALVEEFMKLNGHPPPTIPTATLTAEIVALRQHLMMEELGELTRALNDKSLILAADAITDLLYVVVGTGVALGLGPLLDSLFREVHASNMTKELGPAVGPEGSRRAIKGPSYRPPRINEMVERYEYLMRRVSLPGSAAYVDENTGNPLCTCGHRRDHHDTVKMICRYHCNFPPTAVMCNCTGFTAQSE